MAMTAAGKEPLSGVTLTGFYDDQDISAWAKGYVSAALAVGEASRGFPAMARSTGKDLDAGTKQSLRGLSAALRQTAKALATTKQVKEAKNTVTQIIEDTWNEYTGDVNNILLMDATAEPVSLTDGRNPAPTSIQVLIRTQEIKEEKAEEDEASAAVKEKTTFWGRVTQMFRDFWNAVTGVFQ